LWNTPFSQGKQGIPINGLIWMGNFGYMREQIEEKLRKGFRCVKLKIGAIDFDSELSLLSAVRKHYGAEKIQLRVDANGAFAPQDALYKLKELAKYDIHSIEQPIRQGQWNEMRALCQHSPIPIALDEELIGINISKEKINLLDSITPAYIILKPSLHGGIQGCEEWISLATGRNIGYWITSALESNIGLNAIAQWCATLDSKMYQGLGTGLLFTDNVDIPLSIEKDSLWFRPAKVRADKVIDWLNE
jgi:L-alanine-DL-glutamate epimerase and related enzymes of enolase superfamily